MLEDTTRFSRGLQSHHSILFNRRRDGEGMENVRWMKDQVLSALLCERTMKYVLQKSEIVFDFYLKKSPRSEIHKG